MRGAREDVWMPRRVMNHIRGDPELEHEPRSPKHPRWESAKSSQQRTTHLNFEVKITFL